jgi:AraC-like DNA-binding protein
MQLPHFAYHETPRGVAAMETTLGDGFSTGLHSHPRGQLLYATQGVMTVRSDVGIFVVPPNRAVWLPAGLDHDVKMIGEVRLRTVFVDPVLLSHLPDKIFVVAVSPLLRELIVAAVSIRLDYDDGARDGRVMQLLLDELQEMDVLPLHLPLPSDPVILPICERLIHNPADLATVTEWASRTGFSAKTLHRRFLQATGMTFAQWRQQTRLLHALERLASGDRIIDIALETGYGSQSSFTNMFTSHFGISPRSFYR